MFLEGNTQKNWFAGMLSYKGSDLFSINMPDFLQCNNMLKNKYKHKSMNEVILTFCQ